MRSRGLLVSVATLVAVAVGVPGNATAQIPVGDSVTGSGATESGVTFEVDAHSGPSGENPSGQITATASGPFFEGPVYCLSVRDNVAVLKMGSGFGLLGLTITDNTALGQPDIIQVNFDTGSPTECSLPDPQFTFTLVTGDIVVTDAPPLPTSKDQCKDGGWQTYGVFENQGDCVSFVATGGKRGL